jgi:hypothetical protein
MATAEAIIDILIIAKLHFRFNDRTHHWFRNVFSPPLLNPRGRDAGAITVVRKLIAFDDETFDKLKQLGRDRMGTLQELADEAFADLLRKHGVPVDLKDALRKSASAARPTAKEGSGSNASRKSKS